VVHSLAVLKGHPECLNAENPLAAGGAYIIIIIIIIIIFYLNKQ